MVRTSAGYVKLSASALGIAISFALTGCGIGSLTSGTTDPTAVPDLSGVVHGGQNPLVGSTVTLYATTSNGYGGTATVLGTPVTTDANGAFSFNTQSFTCPANQQAYITASGGNPGLGGGTNGNILLMAALGACANLSQSTSITLNEVTTVAAAYALSGFTSVSGTAVNVTTSSTNNNGSSGVGISGNYAGLAHAFLNAANLANSTTGTANSVTVASGSVGTVPQQEIYFIADALAACVNSSGGVKGDNSSCGNLFAVTPSVGGTFPTNTLQAVLNLALQPFISDANTASFYALVSATPPFPTTYAYTSCAAASSCSGQNPASSGSDWTLAIGYNYVSGNTASSLPHAIAVDFNDDVWVAFQPSTAITPIVELTSNGVKESLLASGCGSSCASNITGALTGATFDPSGNLWLASDGVNPNSSTGAAGLYKYAPSTGSFTFYPTGSVADGAADGNTIGAPYAVAADKNGNIFFGTYSFPANGNPLTAPCGGTGNYCQLAELPVGTSVVKTTFGSNNVVPANNGGATAIAVDNTSNASAGNVVVAETYISNNVGIVAPATPFTAASDNESVPSNKLVSGLAVDSGSNIWGVTQQNGGLGNLSSFYKASSAGVPQSGFPIVGTQFLSNPRYLALDGVGNVFISDFGSDGIAEYNLTKAAFVSQGNNTDEGGYNTYDQGGVSDSPLGIAIDSAGAVWTANGRNDQPTYAIVQTLGVAAPTVAVQALGKYGTLP